ncbi:LicD family protein, partial [Avibacterium paragallinarum]
SLDDIQKISLDILIYFDSFCKRNNINYSLGGGTLIGAVRHKGFIPWDDDVDVYMLKDEYDKFISLWSKESHSRYKLSAAESIDGFMPGEMTKIFDNKTLLTDIKGRKSNLFIDIFIFDGVPSNPKILYKEMKKHRRIKLRFSSCRKRWYHNGKNKILNYIFSNLSIWLFDKMMTNLARVRSNNPIEKSELIGLFLSDYGNWKKSYMKKEYFSSTILADFEGYKFPIMNGYHEHLMMYYGDYMKYPPLDQQKPSHSLEAYLLND